MMFDALGTTTTEDVRRAYEAKRTCDAVRARGIGMPFGTLGGSRPTAGEAVGF